MASGHITSMQIEEEKVETATDFIFLGSKITANGNCSHEIEKCLLLGRKAMTNLDSILKSGDHFATKSPYSQSSGFSSSHVWMWELGHKEGWMLMNWCVLNCGAGEDSWESLGQQDQASQSERKSALDIHLKDWHWSWNPNTLATWCEEPTHWKKHCCWERLKAKGEGGGRGWDG